MLKNIIVSLTANTAPYRAGLASASRDTAAFDAQMQSTAATGGRLGGILTKVVLGGVVALAAGLAMSVGAASTFEASMNRVAALSQATDEDFQSLRDTALELGSSTAFSASEAAEGMSFFAMAGFEANEIISAMPSTLDLATVGQLELAKAADIASNVLQGFGMEASEMARVNDVLALTATSANTSVEQLGDAMSYAAPIANAAGMEIEETAAAIGLLSDAGIQGGRAGTTLVGIIAALEDQAGPAGQKLQQMGIRTHDASGNLLEMADIIEQIEDRGLTAGEALDVFGRRAGPGMAVLVETGSGALRDLETRLDGAAGAAERIAERQFQGLQGAMITLRSATEGLAISVGSHLLPMLTTAVETVAGAVQSMAQVAAGASEEAGRLAPIFENIVSIGGSLADIFRQLAEVILPVVAALAAIAAAGVVAGLELVTGALASMIEFVADNELAFIALAGVLTYMLVPALAAAVTQMQVMAVMGLVRIIEGISAAAGRAAGGIRNFNIAAAGVTAGVVLLVNFYQGLRNIRQEAEAAARDLRDTFGQEYDTSTTEGAVAAIDAQLQGLRDTQRQMVEEGGGTNGWWSRAGANAWQMIPGLTSARLEHDAQVQAITDGYEELVAAKENVSKRVAEVQLELWDDDIDLSIEDVLALADALGIDLTTAGHDAVEALVEAAKAAKEGEPEFANLADEVEALANDLHTATTELNNFVDAMRAAFDPLFAAQDAMLKLGEAQAAEAEALRAITTAREEASEAIEEYGKDSEEAAEAIGAIEQAERDWEASTRDLSRALVNQRTTLAELYTSILEGGGTIAEAERAVHDYVDEWVRAGDLSPRAAKQILEDLGMVYEASAELADQETTVEVDAHVIPALEGLNQVDLAARAWRDEEFVAWVDANINDADRKFYDLNTLIQLYAEAEPTATLFADSTPAVQSMTHSMAMADAYANLDPTAQLYANRTSATRDITAVHRLADIYGGLRPEPTLGANTTGATRLIGSAIQLAQRYGNQTPSATLNVRDNASGSLSRILNRLRDFAGTWTATLRTHSSGVTIGGGRAGSAQADGSVLDFNQVARFANGSSEHHVAQIASPGDWRLWNEPETGGEAYIPLASSKRERSSLILQEVAHRFGYGLVAMQEGGVLVGAESGGALGGRSGAPSMVFGEGSVVVTTADPRRVASDLLHELRWAGVAGGGTD